MILYFLIRFITALLKWYIYVKIAIFYIKLYSEKCLKKNLIFLTVIKHHVRMQKKRNALYLINESRYWNAVFTIQFFLKNRAHDALDNFPIFTGNRRNLPKTLKLLHIVQQLIFSIASYVDIHMR